MYAVDTRHAGAKPSDRKLIMAAVSNAEGGRGFEAVNERIHAALRTWVASQAQTLHEECRLTLGEAHPATITAASNAAALLTTLGRLKEADTLYAAVENSLNGIGDGDATVNLARAQRAGVWLRQGRLDDAVRQLRAAHAALSGNTSVPISDVMLVQCDVATALVRAGRFAEARSLFEGALASADAAAVKKDADDAELAKLRYTAEQGLGVILHSQGDLAGAENFLTAALAGHRSALGDTHPSTLRTRLALAGVISDRGRLDEAEVLLQRTLTTCHEVCGSEHTLTLEAMHAWAAHLADTDRPAEAAAALRDVVRLRRRILGPAHNGTLQSVSNLAAVLYRLPGGMEEAEAELRNSVSHLHPADGCELDLSALGLLRSLSTLLLNRGRHEEAVPLLRQELQSRVHVAGAADEAAADATIRLASALCSLGKHAEADAALCDALRARVAEYGADDDTTLRIAQTIAYCRQLAAQ